MGRKFVSVLSGVLALSFVLTGCLFNTPDQVFRRFFGHLKDMEWQEMAGYVDWPQTARWMPGFPATNNGEDDKKKEIMMQIAEKWTGFAVQRKTLDQIRHEFLYLRISRLRHMKEAKDWAWLEVRITLDTRLKEVEVLVMKINHIWRVVLTDSVFQ
jgi:hypothetical protein